MTSKEKKKKAGHWKMAAHEYYKSMSVEYRRLSFTEQMSICNFLYKMNNQRYYTQEKLNALFNAYMDVKYRMDNERHFNALDLEVFY